MWSVVTCLFLVCMALFSSYTVEAESLRSILSYNHSLSETIILHIFSEEAFVSDLFSAKGRERSSVKHFQPS